MTKVGFPGASIGIFDVIFVYIMNIFLVSTLGDMGLATYLLCMDALVIASIVDIGVSETLTSIVPVYYSKHDYINLNLFYLYVFFQGVSNYVGCRPLTKSYRVGSRPKW